MLDNDHEAPDRDRLQRVLTPDDPSAGAPATPPPPMPTAKPARPAPPVQPGQPAPPQDARPTGGWEVDPDRLNWFSNLVLDARDRLTDVRERVDRMRSEAYTPRLGTSPVGVQLERKFTDRLDAPLDNPERPTTGGLRPMLAEAMRRMEEFIAGAEAAAKYYRELDEGAARTMSTAQSPPGYKG